MFKKKLVAQPLEYWEEKSYMMVIPKDDNEDTLKKGIERLSKSKEFKVIDTNYDVNGVVTLKLLYDRDEYEVGLYWGGISVPEYYLYRNFLFSEEEKKNILNAKKSITIFMAFNDNAKKSYHLQLKIIHTLVPDLIGVMDESAEKMLPTNWVKMAASSKVLPSANDLYNVQAVSNDSGEIWLHTHGLCRCGLTELEILNSDQDNYNNHYNLISTLASFLLDKRDNYNGSAYIGILVNRQPVVATFKSWVDGLKEYKNLIAKQNLTDLLKMLCSAAMMTIVAMLLKNSILSYQISGIIGNLLVVVIPAAAGVIVYFILCYILAVPESRQVIDISKSILKKH